MPVKTAPERWYQRHDHKRYGDERQNDVGNQDGKVDNFRQTRSRELRHSGHREVVREVAGQKNHRHDEG